MAAFCFGRLVFFLTYADVFSSAPPANVVWAFLYGLRFDLSTVVMLTAPFFLILFFPGVSRSPRLTRVTLAALLLWFNALLVYDFVDIQYFGFAQRHLTFEVQSAVHDLRTILGIGLAQYLPELIGLAVVMVVFSLAYWKVARSFVAVSTGPQPSRARTLAVEALVLLILISLEVVFIRGGPQAKPMGVRSAYLNESVELGGLTLNGLYTSLFSLAERLDGRDPVTQLARLASSDPAADRQAVLERIVASPPEIAEPEYPLLRRFQAAPEGPRRWNVVVLILESWSAKFVGALGAEPDATPFFSQLSQDGLLLTNCFANAQRSIEGLSAILGSVPVWPGMVLGQGGLLYQTRLEPVGSVFRANGYQTLFVHGARRGSMGFDGLMRRIGIERHVSREDFEITEATDDGVWGIYDEPAFLRADAEMRRLQEPFYTAVFSLSSHTPYLLPSKTFERFGPEVPFHEFRNSMAYTDWALSRFFETARSAPYFDHTLFVILGDHTEGPSTGETLYEAYHIPCLLYGPGLIKPGRFDGVVTHLDVFPTLVHAVGLSTPFTSWGKSVFAPGPRVGVLPRGDMFVVAEAPYLLLTRMDAPVALYDYTVDPGANVLERDEVTRAAAERMGRYLRAYLRFSYELILENRVRPPHGGATLTVTAAAR
ncbi:MAG: sulfatase-like hydrolase/transferase [Nitrospirota bacterium]